MTSQLPELNCIYRWVPLDPKMINPNSQSYANHTPISPGFICQLYKFENHLNLKGFYSVLFVRIKRDPTCIVTCAWNYHVTPRISLHHEPPSCHKGCRSSQGCSAQGWSFDTDASSEQHLLLGNETTQCNFLSSWHGIYWKSKSRVVKPRCTHSAYCSSFKPRNWINDNVKNLPLVKWTHPGHFYSQLPSLLRLLFGKFQRLQMGLHSGWIPLCKVTCCACPPCVRDTPDTKQGYAVIRTLDLGKSLQQNWRWAQEFLGDVQPKP